VVFLISGGSSVERGWHGGRRRASDGGTEGVGSLGVQAKIMGWGERGREPRRTDEAGGTRYSSQQASERGRRMGV